MTKHLSPWALALCAGVPAAQAQGALEDPASGGAGAGEAQRAQQRGGGLRGVAGLAEDGVQPVVGEVQLQTQANPPDDGFVIQFFFLT